MRRALVFLLAMGCGGGGTSVTEPPVQPPQQPPPATPGRAASLAVTAGANQRAEVGKELAQAIVVRVTDAKSLAVPNQLVNFVVVSGGGKVFAGSAQTTALGEARVRWTLGTAAGEQVLEARAVDQTTGDPIVFAKVTATADPGPPVKLTFADSVQYVHGPFGPKDVAAVEVLLGVSRDLAPLISGAQDQFGNGVSSPALSILAIAPVTANGSSVSSTVELLDTVAITSGTAKVSVQVTVLRNLHDLVGALGAYGCAGKSRRVIDGLGNVTLTRETDRFTVDSIVQPGPNGARAMMWVTLSGEFQLDDGSLHTFGPARTGMRMSQEPGSLFLDGGDQKNGRTLLTNESPLNYVGGDHCANGDWTPLSSYQQITITK